MEFVCFFDMSCSQLCIYPHQLSMKHPSSGVFMVGIGWDEVVWCINVERDQKFIH
jgi:hypothetical protein